MKIAGMKVIGDSPSGSVENNAVSSDRPIAGESPMIEFQSRGRSIVVTLVRPCTTGRCKVLGALIADIVVRRLQAAPIGGSFSTTGINRNQLLTDSANSGLGQQLLNNHLRLFVFALAEVMMSNMPLRIDEIEGRPIFVLERTPYRVVAIDRDRIIDPQVLRSSANVVDVLLK